MLFGTIMIMLIGCKKETEKILEIDSSQNWSQTNNRLEIVCDTTKENFEKIINRHVKTDPDYDKMISKFYQNTNTSRKKVELSEILKLTKGICYEKYVSFEFDKKLKNNTDIKLILIDSFDSKKSCYSIPLFKSVINNYKIGIDQYFEFTKAINDEKDTIIVFNTKGKDPNNFKSVGFDVTQDPHHVKEDFKIQKGSKDKFEKKSINENIKIK